MKMVESQLVSFMLMSVIPVWFVPSAASALSM